MPDGSKGQTVDPVVPLTKAEGAFLGLAAGDALGWPQEMRRRGASGTSPRIEFQTWTRRSGGRFRPFEEVIGAGEYSDDTQLLLAVARCRTTHEADWWKAFATVELPLWTLYERGGGGATKRAAQAWIDGGPPWRVAKRDAVRRYFDAGGNGVAMRVLPHALFLAGHDDPKELVREVVFDGSATHGHPRALVGAVAYAYAAWSLARQTRTLGFGELLDLLLDESSAWGTFPKSDRGGGTWLATAEGVTDGYEWIWSRTVDEMRALIETARRGVRAGALADDHAVLTELGCFGGSKGSGTVTAAAVAYLVARHAAQPQQGVLRAAFESGADTDTLAAMTGGLMGCLAGVEWIPGPWLDVQDAGYLRHMARRVAEGRPGRAEYPVSARPDLRAILSELERNGSGDVVLGNGIRAQAEQLANPRAIAKSIAVRAWRLRTVEGQTLYITKVNDLSRRSRTTRTDGRKETAQSTSSGTETLGASTATAGRPAELLYAEFRTQLQHLLRMREMGSKEIAIALNLVPMQVHIWLERAEERGEVFRASRHPVRFALSQKSLLPDPPPASVRTVRSEPICVPGLKYMFDFISEREEEELVAVIDRADWSAKLQRRVQHYGWRYDYKARQIDASMRIGPLPEWADRLAQRLVSSGLLTDLPDQVIVNEYVGDQGISRHVDVETRFADGIATISLLESWEMIFRARGDERGRKVTRRLDRRSAAVMTGDARYRWTHEIPKRKYEPGRVARGRRISLTFRKVLAPPDGVRAGEDSRGAS